MANAPDYYAVLGVSPAADRVTVHAAWKALLRRYHPDANLGLDVSAHAKAINEAYAVLGKEDARAAYDRSRLPPPPPSPAARPAPYPMHAGRGPMRPRAPSRPASGYAQPVDSNQWLVGLLLLLLCTAPLAMIVVLYYEEARAVYTTHPDTGVRHELPTPAVPGRSTSGITLRPS